MLITCTYLPCSSSVFATHAHRVVLPPMFITRCRTLLHATCSHNPSLSRAPTPHVNHTYANLTLSSADSILRSPTPLHATCFHTLVQIEGPKQVARHSDVDMNGHINNVTYIAWALEIVPEEVYSKLKVAQVSNLVQQHTCGGV